MTEFSNAFHCGRCDVWGALPECWCCGRTTHVHVERLEATGGMHSHRSKEKWAMVYGVTVKIDDDVNSLVE